MWIVKYWCTSVSVIKSQTLAELQWIENKNGNEHKNKQTKTKTELKQRENKQRMSDIFFLYSFKMTRKVNDREV